MQAFIGATLLTSKETRPQSNRLRCKQASRFDQDFALTRAEG